MKECVTSGCFAFALLCFDLFLYIVYINIYIYLNITHLLRNRRNFEQVDYFMACLDRRLGLFSVVAFDEKS